MGNVDKVRGRAKEAFGRLIGDRGLEREGKADRAAGTLKNAVNRVRNAVAGKPRRGRRRRYG